MPVINLETFIGAPVELCFDMTLNVDVHVAATSGLHGRAIAGVTTGVMKLNDEVTWQAKHFGVRLRLSSRITALERPRMFVDEMLHGPFKSWRHVHLFESRPGGTLMTDKVTYLSPFLLLGHFADALFLKRHMERFLTEHNRDLAHIVEREVQAAANAAV
jgi:ligand-binding SRPBCC domain-containing protein